MQMTIDTIENDLINIAKTVSLVEDVTASTPMQQMFDSFALIDFITEVENLISTQYGQYIVLTDVLVFQPGQPQPDIKTLAAVIQRQIAG